MALKKRYIISGGEHPEQPDEPMGTIEIEEHFDLEHGAVIEFVATQSFPPKAPDQVKIWLTPEEATELIEALWTSLGTASAEDRMLLGEAHSVRPVQPLED